MAWEEAPLLDEIAITSGYRATVLNLGLVGVRYQHLEAYVAERGGVIKAALDLEDADLVLLCRCVLDEMRRRGALSRPMLQYHPASASSPEAFGAPADWERQIKAPMGYACDGEGKPLPALDRSEIPYGLSVQGFWRKPKAGGKGPALERKFKTLLGRLGSTVEPTVDLLMDLIHFLMGGPNLIVPAKLHGIRQAHELLQVNADAVLLELLKPADRSRCSICNVRMPWVSEGMPCPACAGKFKPWPDAEVQQSRYVRRLVEGQLITLVAGEHTAQVASERREEMEADFKAPLSRSPLNVLSC